MGAPQDHPECDTAAGAERLAVLPRLERVASQPCIAARGRLTSSADLPNDPTWLRRR